MYKAVYTKPYSSGASPALLPQLDLLAKLKIMTYNFPVGLQTRYALRCPGLVITNSWSSHLEPIYASFGGALRQDYI